MEKETISTFKPDVKDRKILHELDKDCRQSCSEIGKKVGLSSEVVNYRIKKLEEEKVITQYQVIVNISKLKIIQFKIALNFQRIDSQKLESMIKKITKIKQAIWIAASKGNWDLIISCEAKGLYEVNEINEEILANFGNYIREKAIAVCYKGEVFNRDYLTEKVSPNRERVIVDNSKEVILNETEIKIIKSLAENGRKSIVEIAHEIKESERIVNYNIKQLEKKQIIIGFRIALDYSKIGIKYYKTFLYLENPGQKRVQELINYFKSNKNIIHNVQVIGNWDFEPEFETYSEQEFDKILNDFKDKFSDIIKRIDIMTVSKEYKANYL